MAVKIPDHVLAKLGPSALKQIKGGNKPKRNKFGANRTTTDDGIRHDSKREAERWERLRALERAGHIQNLQRQVPIMLQGRDGPLLTRTGKPMRLTVDFTYHDNRQDGALIHEDAKGKPTRDYEVRRAVAAAQGIEVIET